MLQSVYFLSKEEQKWGRSRLGKWPAEPGSGWKRCGSTSAKACWRSRRASGYRQYFEQMVKRIHFIKSAQKLGFSLKEIIEFLMLRVDEQTSCQEAKHRPHTI